MLRLYLIRHGKTYGNTLGRYIGRTDEPLCEEGRKGLAEGSYPPVHMVYSSPLKRCLETVQAIYPGHCPLVEPLLQECDFGDFENKNYQELAGNPAYQAWVDSKGQLPFPGGEHTEAFRERCRRGFLKVLEDIEGKKGEKFWEEAGPEDTKTGVALVIHGGTIMSILEAFGSPKKEFYSWQVQNGQGFSARLDEEAYEKRDEVRLYEIHPISPFAGLSV